MRKAMKFYTSFRKLNIKYKHCIYKFEKKKKVKYLGKCYYQQYQASVIVYRSSYIVHLICVCVKQIYKRKRDFNA